MNTRGIAAPLGSSNIDTDKILPARFLKTTERTGLAGGLFADMREDPHFILNTPPWTEARILIALDNFGCGSSREHAPWALLDFGIRCIIAPSFADIFYNNCFKNGILPVVLPTRDVLALLSLAGAPDTALMTVDLPSQEVRANQQVMRFAVDPVRKRRLLDGTDEIAATLEFEQQIFSFEQSRAERQYWLIRSQEA